MKNGFAELMHELIRNAGVKLISVSRATGYDISYISKWLNGKILPSDKNIHTVVSDVVGCIMDSAEAFRLNKMMEQYRCRSREDLRSHMENALMQAYEASKSDSGRGAIDFYPQMSVREILQRVREKNRGDADSFAAIVDLFGMDSDSRLEFAGIYNGQAEHGSYKPHRSAVIVADMDAPADGIYDCLYLMHVISIYSDRQLKIYNSNIVGGKFAYIADTSVSATGVVFPGDNACAAVSIIDDPAVTGEMQRIYMQRVNNGNLILQRTDMQDFIGSRSYLKSMLSEDNRWLIGHVTELVLPKDLFEELLAETGIEDAAKYREIYDLAQRLINRNAVDIMMYETLLSDLLATGEIDFFNRRILFNKDRMGRFLKYLTGIFDTHPNFRMIKNGFSAHFEHLYNPCLFISGANVYMRLENAYDRDNVVTFIDPKVRQLVNRFYDEAWDHRPDVVISDKQEIGRILAHYCAMNTLLNND